MKKLIEKLMEKYKEKSRANRLRKLNEIKAGLLHDLQCVEKLIESLESLEK